MMGSSGKKSDCLVLGDGLVPFHLAVEVDTPTGKRDGFNATVQRLKDWGRTLRASGVGSNFPDELVQRLGELPGVRAVVAVGPHSSMVIPLRMVRTLGGRRSVVSGVIGAGPVAEAISRSLAAWGMETRFTERNGDDSPLELSVRDEAGHQKTLRVYLLPQRQLRHTFKIDAADLAKTEGFLVSRYNASRGDAARQVFLNGGFTGLRVGELGRFVAAADYLEVLRHFHHVIVPARDGVMAQVARAAGIKPSRGWPLRFDAVAADLATRLGTWDGGQRLVVLVFERGAALYVPGLEPVYFEAPLRFDMSSRAARIHGACAALAIDFPERRPVTQPELESFGERVIQAAYTGTEQRPWTYPSPTFRVAECWRTDPK